MRGINWNQPPMSELLLMPWKLYSQRPLSEDILSGSLRRWRKAGKEDLWPCTDLRHTPSRLAGSAAFSCWRAGGGHCEWATSAQRSSRPQLLAPIHICADGSADSMDAISLCPVNARSSQHPHLKPLGPLSSVTAPIRESEKKWVRLLPDGSGAGHDRHGSQE